MLSAAHDEVGVGGGPGRRGQGRVLVCSRDVLTKGGRVGPEDPPVLLCWQKSSGSTQKSEICGISSVRPICKNTLRNDPTPQYLVASTNFSGHP